MGMKLGVRYSTVNTVVEFEENRRIAWQTGPKGKLEPYVAGRIWRYELEPRGDRTLVREIWDITTDHQRVLLKLGDIYSKKTRRDMELTLARLDALVTAPVAGHDGPPGGAEGGRPSRCGAGDPILSGRRGGSRRTPTRR